VLRMLRLSGIVGYQKRPDTAQKAAFNCIAKQASESDLYDRTVIPKGGEDE